MREFFVSPVREPIPAVIVGAGARVRAVWGPLLRGALADRVRLLGIVGRGRERAQATADALGVPRLPDLDAAARAGTRLALVCTSAHENENAAHAVLDQGWAALLETPLALSVVDALPLAARIAQHGAPVGVAEQNVLHMDQRLLIALAASGALGEPRLVVSDGAGYLYHAAAVAHAALGHARPRSVSAQRVELPGLSVGRGAEELLLVGTARYAGGAVLTLRDAEAAWCSPSPFARGAYRIVGTAGEARGRDVIVAEGAGWRAAPVSEARASDGRLLALSCAGITVRAALPGAPLTDDAQAAAGCLLRLLDAQRGAGHDHSAQHALTDLRVIDAMQRSARLGGALLNL